MKEQARINIPAELMNKFRESVTRHSGLYFKDQGLRNLEGAITVRMAALGLASPAGYYVYLTTAKEKEEELRELLNLLTVNHTYFLRNQPQFKTLRERVLPEIIERRRRLRRDAGGNHFPSLRIWSAGCATGEEPYSIAMVIRDLIKDVDKWNITILATDVSASALEIAGNGIYREKSLRLVEAGRRKRYFQPGPDPGEYRVRDEIIEMVRFQYFNLMETDYPSGFDLIFCRNVIIYFDPETTVDVMKKFYSSLNNDSYLFIGYSESLYNIPYLFAPVEFPNAIIYRKASLGSRIERDIAREIGVALSLPEDEKIAHPVEEIAEEIVKPCMKDEREPVALPSLLLESRRSLELKRYDRVLDLTLKAVKFDPGVIEPYCLAAEAYINMGEFEKAGEKLESALVLDSTSTEANYLRGIIYEELNDIDEAIRSFTRALYINSDFMMARFRLAGLYRDQGRMEKALKEYRNAINSFSGLPLDEIIPGSGGFNAATLISVCRNNIERLKTGAD